MSFYSSSSDKNTLTPPREKRGKRGTIWNVSAKNPAKEHISYMGKKQFTRTNNGDGTYNLKIKALKDNNIGSGSFGEVYADMVVNITEDHVNNIIQLRSEDNIECAITNYLKKNDLDLNFTCRKKLFEETATEKRNKKLERKTIQKVLKALNLPPTITKKKQDEILQNHKVLIPIVLDPVKNDEVKKYQQLTPKMDSCNLNDLARLEKCTSIAKKYLLDHGIDHNDLYRDNIVTHGEDYFLIDFGLAKIQGWPRWLNLNLLNCCRSGFFCPC